MGDNQKVVNFKIDSFVSTQHKLTASSQPLLELKIHPVFRPINFSLENALAYLGAASATRKKSLSTFVEVGKIFCGNH
jgi:hypothetical protein